VLGPPVNGQRPPDGPQGFTSTHSSSALPSTGSEVADVLMYAGGILALGLGLLAAGTRRRKMT
jgi:LPXTG-motif cell wall-anchored protein